MTTHLPSSEEAFNQCREETTCRLDEVFTGSDYSSFAGAAVICHLFNQIMKHVHHAKRDDNPHDFDYGKYWHRHRELDILVSSAFMYLPENFRLPKHLKDPVAVHTNLNLHASTICLHNRAYEMAIEHNLPDDVKMRSKTRLETTAQEIVNIVKLTSHSNVGYVSRPQTQHQPLSLQWMCLLIPGSEEPSRCAGTIRCQQRVHLGNSSRAGPQTQRRGQPRIPPSRNGSRWQAARDHQVLPGPSGR